MIILKDIDFLLTDNLPNPTVYVTESEKNTIVIISSENDAVLNYVNGRIEYVFPKIKERLFEIDIEKTRKQIEFNNILWIYKGVKHLYLLNYEGTGGEKIILNF